jgi:hypothetical protein
MTIDDDDDGGGGGVDGVGFAFLVQGVSLFVFACGLM